MFFAIKFKIFPKSLMDSAKLQKNPNHSLLRQHTHYTHYSNETYQEREQYMIKIPIVFFSLNECWLLEKMV